MASFGRVFRHGGIGRRILASFLLVGLPPLVLIAALAVLETEAAAKARAMESLRSDAKDYGVDIVLRLNADAERAAALVDSPGFRANPDSAVFDYLTRNFESVWIEAEGRIVRPVKGVASNPLAPDEFDPAVSSDLPRLVLRHGTTATDFLLAFRLQESSSPEARIVFRLDSLALLRAPENAPFGTGYCVFAAHSGQRLHCAHAEETLAIPSASDDGLSSEGLLWTFQGVDYASASWRLFLESTFGGPLLEIVATRPASLALATDSRLRQMLLPALILVLLLALLLSFKTVGRSLVPLDRLTEAANKLSSGELDARVKLRSGDEFEFLAGAFNQMAEQLGIQFQTLTALSRIDREILAGSELDTVAVGVLQHLRSFPGCEAAAVIIHTGDLPVDDAKLIAFSESGLVKRDVVVRRECRERWRSAPEQSVDYETNADSVLGSILTATGMAHGLIIPVLYDAELKGLLVLAARQKIQLDSARRQDCADLADRFAVALSSTQREADLHRQAHFDELTSLPNRQYFKDRLSECLHHAAVRLEAGAVLFLDLDRFKEINDLFGHSTGDLVLKIVAERIRSEVEEDDFVARLGGDEFVVLLANANAARAEATASRILSRMREEITVLNTHHYISASIGIVVFPNDGNSVESLLKNADSAMYRAKDTGRNRFEFFNDELNAESQRKIELERQLRIAVARRRLDVYYQPQFDLASETVCGAEALLRWQRTSGEFIAPDEFIPIAEESDLIVEIGRIVIEQVCADLRQLLDAGLHPGPVAINVSPRQFADELFLDFMIAALVRHDINPAYLRLEVTETTVAQNREIAINLLQSAREKGIRVAIDDFGTGYSSLSYLQNLPFDVIKIDKSFIDPIGSGLTADNICRTIIRMAEELGKTAVAEGVETASQADFLRRSGCETAQGFYYSKPIPMSDFCKFLDCQSDHTQRRRALEAV